MPWETIRYNYFSYVLRIICTYVICLRVKKYTYILHRPILCFGSELACALSTLDRGGGEADNRKTNLKPPRWRGRTYLGCAGDKEGAPWSGDDKIRPFVPLFYCVSRHRSQHTYILYKHLGEAVGCLRCGRRGYYHFSSTKSFILTQTHSSIGRCISM